MWKNNLKPTWPLWVAMRTYRLAVGRVRLARHITGLPESSVANHITVYILRWRPERRGETCDVKCSTEDQQNNRGRPHPRKVAIEILVL